MYIYIYIYISLSHSLSVDIYISLSLYIYIDIYARIVERAAPQPFVPFFALCLLSKYPRWMVGKDAWNVEGANVPPMNAL